MSKEHKREGGREREVGREEGREGGREGGEGIREEIMRMSGRTVYPVMCLCLVNTLQKM